MNFFEKDRKTAIAAKDAAQRIAFGPVVFQVARVLRNTGILAAIDNAGKAGMALPQIVAQTGVPKYGAGVLLEAALGIGLVTITEQNYAITRTGHYLLHDDLTRVNLNFIHDVCYQGLFFLDKSIESGQPEGLKVFGGQWKTVYEALAELPPQVRRSWFEFDHFFSDNAFHLVLHHVMKTNPQKILEIGGNTGKWAMAATQYSTNVQITLLDLPGQIAEAQKNVESHGLANRIHFLPFDILDQTLALPTGHDTIWMSQFLDCFSQAQIVAILRQCHQALPPNGQVFIMEPFWDLQKFETAAFCLQQTSIYFTAIANGNSQMYASQAFIQCITEAGFRVVQQIDQIGLSQTLLRCQKNNEQ